MTEEKIAKGRFTWARLVVTYNNGDTIFEDRSDPNFWNRLLKRGISSLSIQITAPNPGSVKHTLKGSKNHNYGWFHYKKRSKTFGGGGTTTRDLAFAIGMVTSSNGDCITMEARPDGSIFTFKSNVVEVGRNLDLHGIKLEEIY